MYTINFADDGIRTADLWCPKRSLCRLSHNHYPKKLYLKPFLEWIEFNKTSTDVCLLWTSFVKVTFLNSHYQCDLSIDQKVAQIPPNVAQKTATADFTIKGPKCHQISGLLLKENLSPRIFKNRPIWSHHWSKENFFRPKKVSLQKTQNLFLWWLIPIKIAQQSCLKFNQWTTASFDLPPDDSA